MNAPMPESERPLWEAIKRHEDLRAMVRDLGRRKLQLQTRLSRGDFVEGERPRLVRDVQQLDATMQDLKKQMAAAGGERNRAEQALQRMRAGAAGISMGKLPPLAPSPPPKSAAFFNKAQLQHIRLLMVRVRSEELKVSARIGSAQDLIAIIEPLIKREEGLQ